MAIPIAGRVLLGLAGSAAARRASQRQQRINVKIEWFGRQVQNNIRIGMRQRVRLAAQLLRDKTVVNISRPVTKVKGPRSGRIQVDPKSRSKPGEFPKADTTRLMKDVFFEMRGDGAVVGSTLDYALILEMKMRRKLFRATLQEMRPALTRILTSGRGGGAALRFPGDTF